MSVAVDALTRLVDVRGTALSSLDLRDNESNVESGEFDDLCRAIANLSIRELAFNGLGKQAVESVAKFVFHPDDTAGEARDALRRLSINSTGDNQAVEYTLEVATPAVRTLDLRGKGLGDEDCVLLACWLRRAAARPVTTVAVQKNCMGPVGMKQLAGISHPRAKGVTVLGVKWEVRAAAVLSQIETAPSRLADFARNVVNKRVDAISAMRLARDEFNECPAHQQVLEKLIAAATKDMIATLERQTSSTDIHMVQTILERFAKDRTLAPDAWEALDRRRRELANMLAIGAIARFNISFDGWACAVARSGRVLLQSEQAVSFSVAGPNTSMYTQVQALLQNTWIDRNTYELCDITSVLSIDNDRLKQNYDGYVNTVGGKEMFAFHGCDVEAVGGVAAHGFLPEYWKHTAVGQQVFGDGCYFALQSSKAHEGPDHVMAALDPSIHTLHKRVMVLCKIAKGKEFKYTSKTLMCAANQKRVNAAANCIVAITEGGGLLRHDQLVVFDSAAVLPVAMVQFTFIKRRHTKGSSVQWVFDNGTHKSGEKGTSTTNYDFQTNQILERAFESGKDTLDWGQGNKQYQVQYLQHPELSRQINRSTGFRRAISRIAAVDVAHTGLPATYTGGVNISRSHKALQRTTVRPVVNGCDIANIEAGQSIQGNGANLTLATDGSKWLPMRHSSELSVSYMTPNVDEPQVQLHLLATEADGPDVKECVMELQRAVNPDFGPLAIHFVENPALPVSIVLAAYQEGNAVSVMLRAELVGLKPGALNRRAREAGVDPDLIDAATDEAEDVRSAVIELIVEATTMAAVNAELDALEPEPELDTAVPFVSNAERLSHCASSVSSKWKVCELSKSHDFGYLWNSSEQRLLMRTANLGLEVELLRPDRASEQLQQSVVQPPFDREILQFPVRVWDSAFTLPGARPFPASTNMTATCHVVSTLTAMCALRESIEGFSAQQQLLEQLIAFVKMLIEKELTDTIGMHINTVRQTLLKFGADKAIVHEAWSALDHHRSELETLQKMSELRSAVGPRLDFSVRFLNWESWESRACELLALMPRIHELQPAVEGLYQQKRELASFVAHFVEASTAVCISLCRREDLISVRKECATWAQEREVIGAAWRVLDQRRTELEDALKQRINVVTEESSSQCTEEALSSLLEPTELCLPDDHQAIQATLDKKLWAALQLMDTSEDNVELRGCVGEWVFVDEPDFGPRWGVYKELRIAKTPAMPNEHVICFDLHVHKTCVGWVASCQRGLAQQQAGLVQGFLVKGLDVLLGGSTGGLMLDGRYIPLSLKCTSGGRRWPCYVKDNTGGELGLREVEKYLEGEDSKLSFDGLYLLVFSAGYWQIHDCHELTGTQIRRLVSWQDSDPNIRRGNILQYLPVIVPVISIWALVFAIGMSTLLRSLILVFVALVAYLLEQWSSTEAGLWLIWALVFAFEMMVDSYISGDIFPAYNRETHSFYTNWVTHSYYTRAVLTVLNMSFVAMVLVCSILTVSLNLKLWGRDFDAQRCYYGVRVQIWRWYNVLLAILFAGFAAAHQLQSSYWSAVFPVAGVVSWVSLFLTTSLFSEVVPFLPLLRPIFRAPDKKFGSEEDPSPEEDLPSYSTAVAYLRTWNGPVAECGTWSRVLSEDREFGAVMHRARGDPRTKRSAALAFGCTIASLVVWFALVGDNWFPQSVAKGITFGCLLSALVVPFYVFSRDFDCIPAQSLSVTVTPIKLDAASRKEHRPKARSMEVGWSELGEIQPMRAVVDGTNHGFDIGSFEPARGSVQMGYEETMNPTAQAATAGVLPESPIWGTDGVGDIAAEFVTDDIDMV